MTKRDYTLISKVLYRARQLTLDDGDTTGTIDWLTAMLCVAFQGENSRFNSDKFKALVRKGDKPIVIT